MYSSQLSDTSGQDNLKEPRHILSFPEPCDFLNSLPKYRTHHVSTYYAEWSLFRLYLVKGLYTTLNIMEIYIGDKVCVTCVYLCVDIFTPCYASVWK